MNERINQSDQKIHPDLLEPWRIIRHFRDLNNLLSLLDYDKEVSEFIERLKKVGWSLERTRELRNMGTLGTRFEALLPRVPLNKGDRAQYRKDKSRVK